MPYRNIRRRAGPDALTLAGSALQMLLAVVDASQDAIISSSLDNRITSWNGGAEKLFGVGAAEALGRSVLEFVLPQEHSRVAAAIAEVVGTLKRVSLRLRSLRRNNATFDSWVNLFPVFDASGSLHAIGAIGRDMTDLVAMQDEQAALATIVNASEDAIVGFSRDVKITSWNSGAEKLYGFTPAEAIGRGFDLFVSPEDLDAALEIKRRVFETGEPGTFQQRTRSKHGAWQVSLVNVFALRDAAGTIVAGAGIGRDITELVELQREQGLLAALVKTSDDAIISLDTDFRITSWNRGAQKLMGYTAEEAVGQRPYDLYVPPADRAYAEANLKGDLASLGQHDEAVNPIEVRLLRKDGVALEVTMVGCPIRDSSGRLIGLSTIMRDVTERKRVERENAALAAIVESSDDAISSVGLDLRIIYWNRGAAKMFGFSADEAIGRPLTMHLPPEQHAHARGVVARIMAHPEEVVRFEGPNLRKDGALVETSTVCFAIRDRLGKVVSISGVQRDITERKRTEREAAMLAAVVNASHDAIINVSPQARIVTWNPAAEEAYGYTAEEAIGRGIELFVPPGELDETIATTRRVVETGQPASWEQHARRRDGTAFVSAVQIFPIRDEAGNVTGVAGIGRDITALKETETQLVAAREEALAASKAKSEFLSSMSHEIRTPMTAILGMAELLADGELNAEQRRYIETLCNNGHTLLDLINSILDLAKIESGRLTLEHVAFDLSEVVEKSAQTLAVRAHAKGLELIVDIAPDLPTALLGDPLRLRQVLINLIGNAIKFTERGEVLVSVERDSGPSDPLRLKFSVRDTGIGIAQDKVSALFAAFAQADSSTARKYGGSGLGLAIVKRLVNLMQGEVRLESALGKGSNFSFIAPFEAQAAPAAALARPDLAGVPILLVERNQTGRAVLQRSLAARGAGTAEAATCAEAMAAISGAGAGPRPRIVLLDDRIGALRALEEVVAAAAQSGASIIAMINSDNLAADVARLRSLKLENYLVRPIDQVELVKTVRHLLAGAGAESMKDSPGAQRGVQPPIVGRPLKILFADDSPDNRTLIGAFLKKTPYHLDEVENGRQAIDAFIAGGYDLVLMDIQMPEVDGYAATRAIRQWEREHDRKRTPIVALTASVFGDAVRLTQEAGCDLHVGKPVSRAALMRAICDAVEPDAQAHPHATHS